MIKTTTIQLKLTYVLVIVVMLARGIIINRKILAFSRITGYDAVIRSRSSSSHSTTATTLWVIKTSPTCPKIKSDVSGSNEDKNDNNIIDLSGLDQTIWGGSKDVKIQVLSRETWKHRAKCHTERILKLMGGSIRYDSTHPIFNFLFEYYHFKPQMLLEYTPGIEEPIMFEDVQDGDEGELLASKGQRAFYGTHKGLVWLPSSLREKGLPPTYSEKHVFSLRFAHQVLEASAKRPPIFFCYGAHEWAMLYHPSGVSEEPHKYQNLPLRISQEVLNEYVESRPIRCTHFDAFRFFTPQARPLNVYADQLSSRRQGQITTEQPGCLHANMDLFKWAIKIAPYVPSSLMEETLQLAIKCRLLDMRASPYDLTAMDNVENFGFETSAVPIETPEGRKNYQAMQEELYQEALPIRKRLLNVYEIFFRALER